MDTLNYVDLGKLGRLFVEVYPQANMVKFNHSVFDPKFKGGKYIQIAEFKIRNFSSLTEDQVKAELVDFLAEQHLAADNADQALAIMNKKIKAFLE